MLSKAFDKTLADALCAQSRSSPRRRAHHALHQSDTDLVHRLFVAIQPDSYVPAHRHLDPNKSETLVVLRGRLGFLEFDDLGAILVQQILCPQDDSWGITIPAGNWHSLIALQPDTLFFEAKAGPYLALTENERAPWAPPEGSPEPALALARLASLFTG